MQPQIVNQLDMMMPSTNQQVSATEVYTERPPTNMSEPAAVNDISERNNLAGIEIHLHQASDQKPIANNMIMTHSSVEMRGATLQYAQQPTNKVPTDPSTPKMNTYAVNTANGTEEKGLSQVNS